MQRGPSREVFLEILPMVLRFHEGIASKSMASKYDGFWRGELGSILDPLQQVHETGRNRELDISELRNHGNRQSWWRVVEFADGKLTRGEMAHVRSLGRVHLTAMPSKMIPNTRFRAIVFSALKLGRSNCTDKKGFAGLPPTSGWRELGNHRTRPEDVPAGGP